MQNRARSIFSAACAYSEAAKHINGKSETDPSLLIPSQVNAALALELYFKSLYFIEQGVDFKIKKKHSHDFRKLFDKLSQNTRNQLIHQFKEVISVRDMSDVTRIESASGVDVPRDLKGNLQSWSGVFTQVRYIYDKPNDAVTMMFFPEIELVVKRAIINLKPDFRVLRKKVQLM